MGFHAVAFGVELCKHELSLHNLLKLIASQVDLYHEDVHTVNPSSVSLDDYMYREDTEAYIVLTLYDDITFKEKEGNTLRVELNEDALNELYGLDLHYTEDNNIHVGQPHCCTTMLYLGCGGDDLGGSMKNQVFSWESLNNLQKWTDALFTEGRLPETSRRSPQLTANCCS